MRTDQPPAADGLADRDALPEHAGDREELARRLQRLPPGHPWSPFEADRTPRPPEPGLRSREVLDQRPAGAADSRPLSDTEYAEHVVTVFVGTLGGARSPAGMFSKIVGAELAAPRDTSGTIPLAAAHEHVVFVATGSAGVEGTVLRPGQLLYLDPGREQVGVSAPAGSRVFLLGGVPLGEQLLMWWNLVARAPEEIEAAVADWREGRFGTVAGYHGEPLAAPPLDLLRKARKP
jgi:hypothetical protein